MSPVKIYIGCCILICADIEKCFSLISKTLKAGLSDAAVLSMALTRVAVSKVGRGNKNEVGLHSDCTHIRNRVWKSF